MNKQKLFLTVILALSLTGCSAPADHSAEIESLVDQVEQLQQDIDDLKSQLETTPEAIPAETTAGESALEETTAKSEPTAQQGIPVALGETITTENMEITINRVELTYDVLPDDTSHSYSHYEADAGNVYLHLDTDIKNLGKQNLPCDELMKAIADYNDGYTYSGIATPEDGEDDFTYANITSIKPLQTLGVHFLFECPQEVEETDNPLFILLTPTGTKESYKLIVR